MVGRSTPVPIDELRAVLAHVRALDVRTRRRTARTQVAAYAAFAMILVGSLRAAAPHAYLSSSPQPIEESRMRILQNLGVVSSIALTASAATAQNAVQWRVEDGGNGHWYEVRSVQPFPSTVALQTEAARSIGADLATIQSPEENSHILAMLTSLGAGEAFGVWIGLRRGAPGEDWHWTDGAPLVWSGWGGGGCQSGPYPNDLAFKGELGVMIYRQNCGLVWDDTPTAWITNPPGWWVGSSEMALLLEWSADCNSDGIVDYGQIRSGQLRDTNANNIPDCCESPSLCDPDPFEWPTSIGGNGHWYQIRLLPPSTTWSQARARAQAVGADLATITSSAENQLLSEAIGTTGPWFTDADGPWIGGVRATLNSPWMWVSGEPWGFTAWCSNQPSGVACAESELTLHLKRDGYCSAQFNWGDLPESGYCPPYINFMASALVEWSSDCNNDGIVDYGQIRAGELADTNANNIPDCCETALGCDPCRADIDQSGSVNGVDLAAVLNNWGTSGGKQPRSDVNSDGIVNGADLAEVLNSWGACP